MSGAASRRKGHQAERDVAAYLRSRGYVDAETTRRRLGHDGAHAPGDVVGIPGLVIEVKDIASSAWPTWCKQAQAEAGDRPWVVVRRLRGCRDVGLWPSLAATKWGTWSLGARSGLIIPFGEYVDWWESDEEAS